MIKNIIREVAPEHCEFSWYFEGDGYTENAGDFSYTLFIIDYDHYRYYGFNAKVYSEIQETAEALQNDFSYVNDGIYDYDGKKVTYKDVMKDYDISYNPRKCHLLKDWAEVADCTDPESIAHYLDIITGKTWEVKSIRGYCQGDYAQVVYCTEHYTEKDAEACGEIWLGCGKEFQVIYLDEEGEEIYSCGGYIVADCQAREDEDYKRLVCEWAGIDEEETSLEMIDSSYTTTSYTYRTA